MKENVIIRKPNLNPLLTEFVSQIWGKKRVQGSTKATKLDGTSESSFLGPLRFVSVVVTKMAMQKIALANMKNHSRLSSGMFWSVMCLKSVSDPFVTVGLIK